MIEIPRTGLKQQTRADRKPAKKGGIGSTSASKFSSELESRIISDVRVDMEELIGDLLEQEKRFLDMQSLYELEKYKLLVRDLLKMILDKGFQTQKLELSGREKRLGRAEKTIVKQIDEGLVKLSTMITRSSDAFELMKQIEEIRGLIFDLVY
ncbi:MAG TPA: DUF327 family protein [Spirochaetota bacterium]|nr:DUF327 family protein [Spirochaetota bacterium]HPR38790.1 DUF327 family protein [Spirochaetota bacterium]HRX46306.1 DUF327 family protein [Spirochaetota bacterium]